MTRQHYVPQFYLKNFSISNREDFIYAYKRNKKIFFTNIKNVAVEKNFYTFKNKITGEKINDIDYALTLLEGEVAPLIKKLTKTNYLKLTNGEKTLLSCFISFLHLKNLSSKERLKNAYLEMTKQVLTISAQNREFFKKHIKNAGIKIGGEKEIEESRKFFLEKKYELYSDDDSYFIVKSLALAQHIAPLIFFKEWNILESDSSRVFVTSDNPVSLIRPKDLPQIYGVGFINGLISIQISPKRCLFLKNEKSSKNITRVNRKYVDFINRHTAFYSYRYIYSNIKSRDIQNMFNETVEGEGEKFLIS